jgi:hypothetical protein
MVLLSTRSLMEYGRYSASRGGKERTGHQARQEAAHVGVAGAVGVHQVVAPARRSFGHAAPRCALWFKWQPDTMRLEFLALLSRYKMAFSIQAPKTPISPNTSYAWRQELGLTWEAEAYLITGYSVTPSAVATIAGSAPFVTTAMRGLLALSCGHPSRHPCFCDPVLHCVQRRQLGTGAWRRQWPKARGVPRVAATRVRGNREGAGDLRRRLDGGCDFLQVLRLQPGDLAVRGGLLPESETAVFDC